MYKKDGRKEGRVNALFLIILFTLCGCSSGGNGVMPDDEGSAKEPGIMLTQTNRWTWDIALYRVSEDHSTIERITNRVADYHFNVTPFVEPPNCNNCLMIGKPIPQPDGKTFKVQVMLTHPFPQQPQFTGFDVRGTIMFPATRKWESAMGLWGIKVVSDGSWIPDTLLDYMPVYFSLAEDGGGQLLNKDGYTFYLYPGLGSVLPPQYQAPIFNYSKGVHANGPDPDSTVNGFKLFTNDPERRMFKVDHTIVRTYHIAPPAGEFIFGYVVDACWAPPTTLPVTDPINDFPWWANCEDGYILGWEQANPFKTGVLQADYYLGRLEYLTRPNEVGPPLQYVHGQIICPDITIIPESAKKWGIANILPIYQPNYLGNGIFRSAYIVSDYFFPSTAEFTAAPGQYTAVVIAGLGNVDDCGPPDVQYPQLFFKPPLFDIIKLEVMQGN